MSLYPAFLKRKKTPEPDPVEVAHEAETDPDALPVFALLPPQSEQQQVAEPEALEEPPPLGRNVHTIGIQDLTRLAIDSDGRLYWDGKPVEVARRILMSREQVIGASVVAAFIVIGAIGAAIQGSAAAQDWACRLGWSSKYCGSSSASSSRIPI